MGNCSSGISEEATKGASAEIMMMPPTSTSCANCGKGEENIGGSEISEEATKGGSAEIMMMSTSSCCANCGKGEENIGDLKTCAACKLVKYCNTECQVAHRPQHKKECKQRASEIFDERLFQHPTEKDECPICFLPSPPIGTGMRNSNCCGQMICAGCVFTYMMTNNKMVCPFCKQPLSLTHEQLAEYRKQRMDAGDAKAFKNEAMCYENGSFGYPRDPTKAFELYLRASELGNRSACLSVADAYLNGEGVEKNLKKSKHYYEQAALRGSLGARHFLGDSEWRKGNYERATKHYMVAAAFGDSYSVYQIQEFVKKGYVASDHYENALKVHQEYIESIRSDQRDEAVAAIGPEYSYYEPLQLSIDDNELFKQPPPNEDCPVCCIPLPLYSDNASGLARRYQSCCGQIICVGCMYEVEHPRVRSGDDVPCPSCKTLVSEDGKAVVQGLMKRSDMKDVNAMTLLGSRYAEGNGVPRNVKKAIEIWEEAAELGGIWSAYTLGNFFLPGSIIDVGDTGIRRDREKAIHYYTMAAKGGHDEARFKLGHLEVLKGNKVKAAKHFLISAAAGHDDSLTQLKMWYTERRVTKEELATTLRAHKESQDSMKSAKREEPKAMERRMMGMLKVMTGGQSPDTFGELDDYARKLGMKSPFAK